MAVQQLVSAVATNDDGGMKHLQIRKFYHLNLHPRS